MELERPNPRPNSWLSDKTWGDILALSQLPSPAFEGFYHTFEKSLARWEGVFNSQDPEKAIKDWFGDNLKPFQVSQWVGWPGCRS